MKKLILLFIAVAMFSNSYAADPLLFKFNSGDKSSIEQLNYKEYIANPESVKVEEALMFVYLPEESADKQKQAVLVCPGGAYYFTAIDHEGHQVAQWLNEFGVAGIVIKYRMPNFNSEIPLKDTQITLQFIRDNSAKWGIDPSQVGVMGFSAGGHLASTLSTHFTTDSERPDFSILIYPVITMDQEFTHSGSRYCLLGGEPSAEQISYFSNEKRVTDRTPPTFIALSDDDKLVLPRNSVEYYMALNRSNVPSEMHIYPYGGHGWGMSKEFRYANEFRESLRRWIKDQKKSGQ